MRNIYQLLASGTIVAGDEKCGIVIVARLGMLMAWIDYFRDGNYRYSKAYDDTYDPDQRLDDVRVRADSVIIDIIASNPFFCRDNHPRAKDTPTS